MYDNKVRLSPDVLEKASAIAHEWGLKNARAAVEAVFRRYADEYLTGRQPEMSGMSAIAPPPEAAPPPKSQPRPVRQPEATPSCEALDALDELLGAF
ncbi:hypothetical protein ACQ4M4_06460 [Leptolyngbya sp. AN02str]|uniref:hypothetical protein n=1 Tax=Leptolyngbya sp. AN02str TaxID=3423363 RepID=UPI003D310053